MRVITSSGLVEGQAENEGNIAFIGIPFGKALRFKRPTSYHGDKNSPVNVKDIQPLQPTAGFDAVNKTATKEIKKMDLMKIPDDVTVGENCLNLTVTTPDIEGKLPVVVDFFGGGFAMGGDLLTPTMKWLKDEKIVYVRFNYRVGILGWSQLPDIADTNVGMYDQKLALEWVMTNISRFGGDPEQVTLVGSSAGAKSISALMASNFSVMDSISRIWTVSGGFQAIRDMNTASKVSQNFLEINAITQNDLLGASSKELMSLQRKFNEHANTNDFGPVIDRETIKEDWRAVLDDRLNKTHLHAMVSSSDHEYAMQATLAGNSRIQLSEDAKNLFGKNTDLVLAGVDTKDQLVDALGKAMYRLPSDRTAEIYAQNTNTSVWVCHSNMIGGVHTSDAAVLNMAEGLTTLTSLIQAWQGRFLTFAKTGVPNGSGDDEFDWLKYRTETRVYAQLDPDGPKLAVLDDDALKSKLPLQALVL